jgi:putative aldouronate transport system permease protein
MKENKSKSITTALIGANLVSYARRSWMLYLMLLLPISFFVIFRYVPMTNIVIAFKDYNIFQGVWVSPWAGASSYQWNQIIDGVPVPISGATNASYEIQPEDEGKILTVTIEKAGYTGSITSDPIFIGTTGSVNIPEAISDSYDSGEYYSDEEYEYIEEDTEYSYAEPPPISGTISGTVRIKGNAAVGQTLKADTSKVSGGIFKWFEHSFTRKDFWDAMRNTVLLNFLDLIVGFPAPIILALVLNELIFKSFKKVTQTIIYLPHFLSWIIVSSIATRLLAPTNGVINIFIAENFGMKPIDFLMNSKNWVMTYIVFGVWKEMGWGTIIYLAAITGINPELYEAAEVDGAGRWRKLWHITLPGIRPTIVVLLIMNIGRILGIEFDRPYTMANRVVRDVSDVLSTLVYRVGILSNQFSLTAAIGLFQSIICVIFLVTANSLAKRFGERGIW